MEIEWTEQTCHELDEQGNMDKSYTATWEEREKDRNMWVFLQSDGTGRDATKTPAAASADPTYSFHIPINQQRQQRQRPQQPQQRGSSGKVGSPQNWWCDQSLPAHDKAGLRREVSRGQSSHLCKLGTDVD